MGELFNPTHLMVIAIVAFVLFGGSYGYNGQLLCTATLTYWLHVDTTENTTTATPDTLTVQVLNSSGSVLATLATYSNLDPNTGYTQQSADLSAYAGQTITLKFTGTETDTNGGTTDFVFDDTALQVS